MGRFIINTGGGKSEITIGGDCISGDCIKFSKPDKSTDEDEIVVTAEIVTDEEDFILGETIKIE